MKNIIKLSLLVLLAFASVRCAQDNAAAAISTGMGGSLARFTIIGNYLYTVDFQTLSVFDISNPAEPALKNKIKVGNSVETIFPLNNWLFLGTNSGMFIYQIDNKGVPQFISDYQHITSCDPVVANENYAYVTLRATRCNIATPGAADLLEIIDISDPKNPILITSYNMSEPRGLGLDENILFVCNGNQGVRVFDVSNPAQLQEITQLNNIIANDVIVLNGLLLVVGPDNIYQYNYTNVNNIRQVSKISIGA
ncbi:MAG: LVIVD repeat-containing protein [Saprospiraceae bacterium]